MPATVLTLFKPSTDSSAAQSLTLPVSPNQAQDAASFDMWGRSDWGAKQVVFNHLLTWKSQVSSGHKSRLTKPQYEIFFIYFFNMNGIS